MSVTLEQLIVENREALVDAVAKDAVGQIRSYGEAPLRTTISRVESWLDALAASVGHNEAGILEEHLVRVAGERMAEGYVVGEVHAIIQITERRIQDLILSSVAAEVERNGLLALLDAVMGAARMVLSVRYALAARNRPPAPGAGRE
jgi:hypothetical protein